MVLRETDEVDEGRRIRRWRTTPRKKARNENPKPCKCVISADEILASGRRVCQKTMNRT